MLSWPVHRENSPISCGLTFQSFLKRAWRQEFNRILKKIQLRQLRVPFSKVTSNVNDPLCKQILLSLWKEHYASSARCSLETFSVMVILGQYTFHCIPVLPTSRPFGLDTPSSHVDADPWGLGTLPPHINLNRHVVPKSFLKCQPIFQGKNISFIINNTARVQCISSQRTCQSPHPLDTMEIQFLVWGLSILESAKYLQGICNKKADALFRSKSLISEATLGQTDQVNPY